MQMIRGRELVQDVASAVDPYKKVIAAATLKPYEKFVEVDTTAGAFTLKMPPVAECAGKTYSIMITGGATTACTLAPYASGDSYDWTGDFTIDASLDRILLFSDGRKWWVLENLIS
jgi:hypothetical protein